MNRSFLLWMALSCFLDHPLIGMLPIHPAEKLLLPAFSLKSNVLNEETGSSLVLNNGSISNQGNAFFKGDSIYLYRGVLSNTAGGDFASCVFGNFYVNGTAVSAYNDSLSKLGPFQLVMQDGTISNDGLLSLDLLINTGSWQRELAHSTISGGAINGIGQMWISGNASLQTQITQGQLVVGQGVSLGDLITPEITYGSLNLQDGVVDAPCIVSQEAIIQGSGTLTQQATIYGLLYPGSDAQALGVIYAAQDVNFEQATSGLGVHINNENVGLLSVAGTINFDPESVVYLKSIQNPSRGYRQYILTEAAGSNGILPSVINQTTNTSPYLLQYVGNNLVLDMTFPSSIPLPPSYIRNPSIKAMVETLNTLDGQCPQALQSIIDTIIDLPENQMYQVVAELLPYLKKAQVVFEKLDLTIGELLRNQLYKKESGPSFFAKVGFDSMHQKKYPYYVGYNSNSYYELFGMTFGPKKIRGQLSMGFGQIFMHTVPNNEGGTAHAIYLNAGWASHFNRLSVGIDMLGSFGRMKAWRHINYFSLKAKDKRNLWNVSYMGKGELHVVRSPFLWDLYLEAGQNFGKENPYLETGAPGADLFVCKEKINAFRGCLGLKIGTPTQKPFSCFIDAAYVFDSYSWNSRYYDTAFEGTNVFTKITDFFPPHNLTRIQAGLSTHYKRWGVDLSYISLFGKKFSEHTASIDLKIFF